MTMPRNARKVIVDETQYLYMIKGGKAPHRDWTPKELRLTIELSAGRYATVKLQSKAWTANHDTGEGEPHKVSVTLEDVRHVITALTFHQGKLPIGFELPSWKVISNTDSLAPQLAR